MKRIWLCVLLCLAPAGLTAQGTPQRHQLAAQRPVEQAPATLEPKQILQRESPGIVTVFAVDNKAKPFALGSGFIIRSNGLVITNYHVIRGASDAQIKLQTGEIYENVRVFDYDRRRDIAILKIRAAQLPTVTIGDSNSVDAGDRAYAIGNPEGYSYTISDGLISARRILDGNEEFQITVPISHGSSGGPLYNTNGQVIGITSSGYMEGAQNLNFAIPIKYVLAMLESTSQDITLAQLTEKMRPLDEATEQKPETQSTSAGEKPAPKTNNAGISYADPSGWVTIDFPVGWQLDQKPIEGTLFSASKGDNVVLMGFRSPETLSAADWFAKTKKVMEEKYTDLAIFSEEVKLDEDKNRHMKVQSFRTTDWLIFIGAFQNDQRVVGLIGLCKDQTALSDLVAAVQTVRY
jgi:S1-C subfamily serine protease